MRGSRILRQRQQDAHSILHRSYTQQLHASGLAFCGLVNGGRELLHAANHYHHRTDTTCSSSSRCHRIVGATSPLIAESVADGVPVHQFHPATEDHLVHLLTHTEAAAAVEPHHLTIALTALADILNPEKPERLRVLVEAEAHQTGIPSTAIRAALESVRRSLLQRLERRTSPEPSFRGTTVIVTPQSFSVAYGIEALGATLGGEGCGGTQSGGVVWCAAQGASLSALWLGYFLKEHYSNAFVPYGSAPPQLPFQLLVTRGVEVDVIPALRRMAAASSGAPRQTAPASPIRLVTSGCGFAAVHRWQRRLCSSSLSLGMRAVAMPHTAVIQCAEAIPEEGREGRVGASPQQQERVVGKRLSDWVLPRSFGALPPQQQQLQQPASDRMMMSGSEPCTWGVELSGCCCPRSTAGGSSGSTPLLRGRRRERRKGQQEDSSAQPQQDQEEVWVRRISSAVRAAPEREEGEEDGDIQSLARIPLIFCAASQLPRLLPPLVRRLSRSYGHPVAARPAASPGSPSTLFGCCAGTMQKNVMMDQFLSAAVMRSCDDVTLTKHAKDHHHHDIQTGEVAAIRVRWEQVSGGFSPSFSSLPSDRNAYYIPPILYTRLGGSAAAATWRRRQHIRAVCTDVLRFWLAGCGDLREESQGDEFINMGPALFVCGVEEETAGAGGGGGSISPMAGMMKAVEEEVREIWKETIMSSVAS